MIAYRVYRDCNGDGLADGAGSGTAIGPRTILTADHVVAKCNGGAFVVISDRNVMRRVTVGVRYPGQDQAELILVDGMPENPVWARRDCRAPRLGERTLVYVGDGDIPMYFKELFISGLSDTHVLLSGHVVGGNSGGGLFDTDGCMIGVVIQGDRRSVDMEFWGVASRF